jgi:uncharacterized DUF497 family protein
MARSRVKIPNVLAFLFDDQNEGKLNQHGLTPEQVDQVLENAHLVGKNRRNRRAPFFVIGKDHSGECIAVPIEPTYDVDLWRPVTAWRCKEHERQALTRRTNND